jgi:molecular chaperone GrpE (heat shock protein)
MQRRAQVQSRVHVGGAQPGSAAPGAGSQTAAAAELRAEPLAELEQYLRTMMRELGEARFALEEARRETREHTRKLLLGLLSGVDAFDRVLQSMASRREEIAGPLQPWFKNLRTARNLFDRVLQDEGLIRITPEAQEGFDPHWHRVSGTVVDPNQPDGAIVEISSPGWLWEGTLLRKTAVVVVQNGEAPAPGEAEST